MLPLRRRRRERPRGSRTGPPIPFAAMVSDEELTDATWADDTWEQPKRRRRGRDDGWRNAPPKARIEPSGEEPTPGGPTRSWRRLRRTVAGALVIGVIAVTAAAFWNTDDARTQATDANPAPVGVGGPTPPPANAQQIARAQGVPLYLPINPSAVTAILYHRVDDAETISLEPVGRLRSGSLVERIERDLIGGSASGAEYSIAEGSTASMDVGALAGTSIYAPVDGRVVGIIPNILNAQRFGSIVTIEPASNPSLVVVVSHVDVRLDLKVGDIVSATGADTTLLGAVVDMAPVLDQLLSRYTPDAGNHVHIELRRNTTTQIP